MGTMLRRMKGVALFDATSFDEVRLDPGATTQAVVVVILAGLSEGLVGVGLGWTRLLEAVLTVPAGWMIWAGITMLVGIRLFGGKATWAELLRVLGFAHAPWTLACLGLVPGIGWLVSGSVLLWTLAVGWAVLRRVLVLDPARTLATVAAGWSAVLAIEVLF